MKNRSKIVVGIFCFFICMTFFSHMAKSIDFPDIFVNYQSYNSNISFNYGSLVKNATESNNYRNILDTSIKANDFDDYDDMASLTNTIDYTNYLYQQQKYEFNDDSFNLTSGNYSASFSFENETILPYDFTLRTGTTDKWSIDDFNDNHLSVLHVNNDNTGNSYSLNIPSENQEYGTIELWYYMSSGSTVFGSIIMIYGSLGGYSLYLYVDITSMTIKASGIGSYSFCSFSFDTWYHIRIDFEFGNNGYLGLAADTFSTTINGVSYGSGNMAVNNALDYVAIGTFMTAACVSQEYYDAIGFSWFSNYTIEQNILSEYQDYDIYNDDYDLHYSYDNDLSGSGTYVRGITYHDDYYYVCSHTTQKTVEKYSLDWTYQSSTTLTQMVSENIDPIAIDYDSINNRYYILGQENSYVYVFNSAFTYLTKYDVSEIDMVDICIYDNRVFLSNKNEHTIYIYDLSMNLINYYYNNSIYFRGITYDTFLNKLIIMNENTIDSIYNISMFNYDKVYDEIEFESFLTFNNINGFNYYVFEYDFDNDLILAFLGSSNDINILIHNDVYINKFTLNQYYFYDNSNNLKGKIDIIIDGYHHINDKMYLRIYNKVYYYSGSFIELIDYYNIKFIDITETSSLEIHNHVISNYYYNIFKKTGINITIFNSNQQVIDSIIFYINYMSSYSFDKIKLNDFSYYQSSEGYFDVINNVLLGVNDNFFKNDLKGFRTLGCLDLNQKFSKFYDFGMFSDIIDIFELELPEIDEQEPPSDIWLPYLTSYIELDDNYTVSTLHLSVPYPRLQVVYTVEKYYFKRFYYTGALFSYIGGNWGIFLDWVRALLNLIVDVLNFLILFFAEIIPNIILLGGQFVFGYLLFLAFHTLIMTFIVNIIGINLFWNLVIPLLILLGLLVCEGLIALYVLLIILVNWIFEIVIPGIIIGGTLLLSGLIALFLWLLTGFQGNYLEILNTVNSLLSQITLGFYEVFLIILTHILIVLLYFSAYLLCVEMVLIKYYYTKARGFKGRSERIYESYLSYRLVIEVPISIFNWFKRLIFRWT